VPRTYVFLWNIDKLFNKKGKLEIAEDSTKYKAFKKELKIYHKNTDVAPIGTIDIQLKFSKNLEHGVNMLK
jgi:hypothetical protein